MKKVDLYLSYSQTRLNVAAACLVICGLVSSILAIPAFAQEETQSPETSLEEFSGNEQLVDDSAAETEPSPDSEIAETIAPFDTTTSGSAGEPSIQVSRSGSTDEITVDENEGDMLQYLSSDMILGLVRDGAGEISSIDKINADGTELEAKAYAVMQHDSRQLILIDAESLSTIPPQNMRFNVEADYDADYRMAMVHELPSRFDLQEQGIFAEESTIDSQVDLAHRSAAQCEPTGTKTFQSQAVTIAGVSPERGNLRRVTLRGLQPSGIVNEIQLKLRSGQFIATPSASLIRDREGKLISGNGPASDVDSQISRDKRTVTLRFSNQEVGKEGRIDVLVPSSTRNQRDYVSAQVNTAPRLGNPYHSPKREEDLASPAGPRLLTEQEKKEGTKIYVSVSRNSQDANDRNRDRMDQTVLAIQEHGQGDFSERGTSGWIYNALAYDPDDDWLYGVSQYRGKPENPCFPPGHLLQINPVDGSVRNLGPLLDSNGNDIFVNEGDRKLLNAGAIYDRHLYVSNSSTSGSRTMYKIPLPSNGNFTAGKPRIEKLNYRVYSEDYARLSSHPQYVWGLVSPGALGDNGAEHLKKYPKNQVVVERLDLQNGSVQYYPLSDSQLTAPNGEKLIQQTTWGKAWTYGNGNLGFAPGGQSRGVGGAQISVKNPVGGPEFKVEQVLWNVPFSYNTDASSNANRYPAPTSDLTVNKRHLGGHLDVVDNAILQQLKHYLSDQPGYNYWAIELKNSGDTVVSGSSIREHLPDVYDPQTLVASHLTVDDRLEPVNPGVPVRISKEYLENEDGSNTAQFGVGQIQPNQTVRVYIAVRFKQGKNECKANTVSVLNNDQDSNPDDNQSTAACVQDPKIGFELHKVDASELDSSLPAQKLTGGNFVLLNATKEDGSVKAESEVNWQAATHPSNPDVTEIRESEEQRGEYRAANDLEIGKYYWLIETQAPTGADGKRYNLLVKPVLFQLVRDPNTGNARALFFDDTAANTGRQEWTNKHPVANMYSGQQAKDKITIKLANIQQGEMPLTGGSGVWRLTIIGLLVILVGVFGAVTRRKATIFS
ncbi:DUF6923 family protein [Corynebacterium pseudodiphtheriticum]|uniref:DUF6923 family protein n=1 Tax=Corynebacterium pseudodiphtheriticum TaxID=37637 RepID=UPI0025432913|nr:hypothetical protein [Corynebacterium pseudodiphtheriticum]MDK4318483.1 hypothetical protein [Corynebacterium pseudodiphtheriticum]